MITIVNPIRFFGITIIGILIVIGGIGWFLIHGSVEKTGQFEIEPGTGAKAVWKQLVEEGYFTRTTPLKYSAWKQGTAGQIQAGIYQLEIGESAADVITRMAKGDVVKNEFSITYPEGFTLEQIAARTAARGIGTQEEFIAAAKPENFAQEFPFLADLPAGRTLEGYLFPDTYKVFEDDTPEDVIRRMLANFAIQVPQTLQSQLQASGHTLDEAVIMGSIVEREVVQDDDMALVAGVLWNRVNDGEGLYADATIRYALDKWEEGLTVTDLAVDSPYNTRKYKGLPPGPISNPGIRALRAAITPEESDYYYYLSAPNGETIFSKTNDEHNLNKQKYLQ